MYNLHKSYMNLKTSLNEYNRIMTNTKPNNYLQNLMNDKVARVANEQKIVQDCYDLIDKLW